MKTIVMIALFFVSTLSMAGAYTSAYVKINLDTEKFASNADPSKKSALVGLLGYRSSKDKGVSIDIMTSDFGGPGFSIGAFSKEESGIQYNGGMTMVEGLDGNIGFYFGGDYKWFSTRLVLYSSQVDVTATVDLGPPTGIVNITTEKKIDRAMLWVGVTHNF